MNYPVKYLALGGHRISVVPAFFLKSTHSQFQEVWSFLDSKTKISDFLFYFQNNQEVLEERLIKTDEYTLVWYASQSPVTVSSNGRFLSLSFNKELYTEAATKFPFCLKG